jgi:hypothetical protein
VHVLLPGRDCQGFFHLQLPSHLEHTYKSFLGKTQKNDGKTERAIGIPLEGIF